MYICTNVGLPVFCMPIVCPLLLFSYFADSGFVPVFNYAIFGSSCQLAIGPVALVSLLISNGLTPLVDLAEEVADVKYTQLCILLVLMVGVMESLMCILR
jgi:sulfate transporter 4